jgi:uncharacterized membrane protein
LVSAKNVALIGVAYVTGLGMLYVSAAAAQQLFHNDNDPSAIASLYRPIYGDSFWDSFMAHMPQLPLLGEFAREGMISGSSCVIDIVKKPGPGAGKEAVLLLNLAILGFTTLTTYLIASYGSVDLCPLILALISAVLGNYVPSVKCSQAIVNLSTAKPAAALESIVGCQPVASFLEIHKKAKDQATAAIVPSQTVLELSTSVVSAGSYSMDFA